MPVTKGSLKPADERAIKTNYRFIIKEVDALDLIDGLYEGDVFTTDDIQEIKALPSQGKRTELMLYMLQRSGPGQAFATFLELLREAHEHVVEKLEESISESEVPPDSPWAWYDELPENVKSRTIGDADSNRISSKIGTGWQTVILRLGLTSVNISQELARHPHDPSLVITGLLIRWRQSKGRAATLQCLVNVLQEVSDIELDMEGLKRVILDMNRGQILAGPLVTEV